MFSVSVELWYKSASVLSRMEFSDWLCYSLSIEGLEEAEMLWEREPTGECLDSFFELSETIIRVQLSSLKVGNLSLTPRFSFVKILSMHRMLSGGVNCLGGTISVSTVS